MVGRPARWQAAAIARCRPASGFRAGVPRPQRVKVLRSDRQLFPSAAGGRVEAAEPLGQGEGVFGLCAVGEESAGLPAHPAAGTYQGLLAAWQRRWPDSPTLAGSWLWGLAIC